MKAPWNNKDDAMTLDMPAWLRTKLSDHAKNTGALGDADAISELLVWYEETLPIVELTLEIAETGAVQQAIPVDEEEFLPRFQNRQLAAMQRDAVFKLGRFATWKNRLTESEEAGDED